IIPNKPASKKRGKKHKMKRKEPEELERAAASGKLSKYGRVSMKCSQYREIGHNKRYHERESTSSNIRRRKKTNEKSEYKRTEKKIELQIENS
ncbi:hypothetical protein MANES_02G196950v8, partial [Manihot esculenta]